MSEEYATVQEEIDALDIQVEEALKGLRTERQRKFAIAYTSGETGRKSMIDAGYDEASAGKNLGQIKSSKGMDRALTLIRRQHQLAHGLDPKWKRQALVDITETAKKPGDNYNPAAAVRSVEILSKIDGDIQQHQVGNQGGGGVTIQIVTGIPERPLPTASISNSSDIVDSVDVEVEIIESGD